MAFLICALRKRNHGFKAHISDVYGGVKSLLTGMKRTGYFSAPQGYHYGAIPQQPGYAYIGGKI